MSKYLIPLASVIIMLSACSDDTSTVTSNDNNKETSSVNNKQSNPLSGFKSALDTAKSVTSTASEIEKKKQQALQDTYQ